MEITQAQFTIGGLITIASLLGTLLTIYRLGVRPVLDRAHREALETSTWRLGIDHKIESVSGRLNRHERRDDRILDLLDNIQKSMAEVTNRLVAVETELKHQGIGR